MKNLLIKLLCLFLVVAFSPDFLSAQTMGKPNGNNLDFFATNNTGKQIGHRQLGAWGTFNNNARWIGIGQPSVPSSVELYGMRIQDRTYVASFSLNGSTTDKDLEIQWGRTSCPTAPGGTIGVGGIGGTAPPPANNALCNPQLKFNFISSPTASQLAMRLSKNGYLETFGQQRAYSVPGNFSNYTEMAHGGSNGYINTVGNGNLELRHDGDPKTRLTPWGNFTIGVLNPSTAFKLEVNGLTRCTFGVWTSSDEKFKTNVAELGNVSDKLASLKGVTYDYNAEAKGGIELLDEENRTHYGFIAQDLEKVFPDLVITDEYGAKAIRYEGLIPVLVEGFKNQTELVDEQENTITSLTTEVENLKAQLSEIVNVLNSMQDEVELKLTPTKKAQDAMGSLEQNRPNPFKGITTIDYKLPKNASNATLKVK